VIVREPTPDEALRLWPSRKRRWPGPRRVLDFEEQREIVWLYRTRQATAVELARRYGVADRTIHRYIRDYPALSAPDSATARTIAEWGRQRQIPLTHDDVVILVHALQRRLREAA
jgi:transposase-like protein